MQSKWHFKVLIFLSFMAGGLLSGCGSEETEGNESITLQGIMEQVPDADIVEDMLEDFNGDYPNINIEIEILPYDQMRERILSSSMAPDPVYDFIIVDNPWMYDLASAGHLDPLSERIEDAGEEYDYEDFVESLRDIAEVDDEIYAVPFYNYALGLIYRQDLFEEEGITAPNTVDELQSISELLTSDDHAGIAMQPERGYKIFEEWANWLFAAGGAIQNESGEIVLNSPEAREALTKYIETYNSSAPRDSLNWGFDEALRSVSSGQAAMMLSYNWMLPTLNTPDGPAGELTGDFQLAKVPGGEPVLGAWYWAITANTDKKEEAWEFIRWITEPEQDLERVLRGGAPIRHSVMEEAAAHEDGFGKEYYNTVNELLENSAPIADGPNAEEVIQAIGTELSEAITGNKSVDQAITDAAENARDIMDE